ncbi:MAG TPA: EAL domain-containing protein [Thermoanaerobaculia bacterium]|jgi:diguanylate cyclase (GGDEF)-like protein/PAS domain S-box-containing protein
MSVTPPQALRVLIVEDSAEDAQLLQLQLRRNGYKPLARRVQTAEEMEQALDEQPWDLVLADYSLPTFNALGALEIFHRRGLDIPFLIVSGTIGEETAVEAMRAGAHDYIMKGSSARLIPAIARELREAGERANRRRAEEALRDSERRFRALIEYSSDILTVLDAGGRILYESPSVERLLGHTAGELMGAALEEHVHPEDRHALATALTESAGASTPVTAEFRMRARNGEWRIVEASVSNLLDNAEVGGIVLNSRDITARKQDEEMIRHLAYFDALTGLPNRMLFDDRLAQALAHSRRRGARGLAIMCLDLDRFKTINETLGHGAGDELLRAVASSLSATLREEDTVARLGGDEFLFLLPEVDDVEDAARVARKILTVLEAPFSVHGHELHLTASVGIAMFPLDGDDAETLIRNADTALYRAKKQGGNRYQLYAPAMNAIAYKRLVLENSLRRAIEREEFRLHYQPLVSLHDGRVVGVEALIRWQHPELGLVSPAEFIPLAEETGLVVPLTHWVLRTACRQMKEWQAVGLALMTVAVNISAQRFSAANLPVAVAEALTAAGLDGRHLCLELTESVMMEDVEETIATLLELKKLHVKISIDDFGTGYSSLSYLKRLPIDTLKIDQSFVRNTPADADDAAIAKLIISMAHHLNLSVVAEGVETEEQLRLLRSQQCDIMQGYLVSKPLPGAEMTEMLSRLAQARV